MRTVYLVEDNSADVELFRLSLAEASVSCHLKVFGDGRQAIDYVRHNPAAPDLIVLDMNLPKLDGVELLTLLRGTPGFGDVPVVSLSSSSSPRDQLRLSELNIAASMVKPADLDEYMKIGVVLRRLLTDRAQVE